FPCYVVAFSLMIYFIGYKLRAGETEWNELHFVDVLARGDGAALRGRTYASIYSPVNSTYNLESHEDYSAFRGEFLNYWGVGDERAEVCSNGENYKASIFVPVWTSQLYVSDWWQSAALPFECTVAMDGQNWSVTVSNHRDRPITGNIAIGGRLIELGGEIP